MIDLPQLLFKKDQQEAREKLLQMQIIHADQMESNVRERFVNHLTAPLEQLQDEEKYDAEGVARLRSRLQGR